MNGPRDAVITGIGLVSSLGEGEAAHLDALDRPGGIRPVIDTDTYAPMVVHPMAQIDLDRQIPKKGDQRQMEPWQRIGTFAAGLALDHAGAKGDAELLGRMDLIVAAGGGERDIAADQAILSDLPRSQLPDVLLNERLMSDLRPTLFLAQLSNLLAGNISVVHGVVGSSRTLMGEEVSAADAVRIAAARIAASTSDICLVGGSFNAQRFDIAMHCEMGHVAWRHQAGEPVPGVWTRQAMGGGMIQGSVGAFLVIEARAHAAARGVTPVARVAGVETGRCNRAPGASTRVAASQFAALQAGRKAGLSTGTTAVLSGATGVAGTTSEEETFLKSLGIPFRGTATALGHSVEASFPANLALAAMTIRRGFLFAPLEARETPMDALVQQVLVTCWGQWRGEAMALITAA